MTRKLAVSYLLLFLFVFTFALSFALAGEAQAQSGCCIVWCDEPFGYIAYVGHTAGGGCVCDGTNMLCDQAYMCPK